MTGIWAGGVILILTAAALGSVWLYRILASRRLHAAADAYANREMARTRRDGVEARRGPFRTAAGGVSARRVP